VRVDRLTTIKVFRQVVESGTFVSAASRLDVSTAMVSKHVMHLEQRLGVRLLNRNNRGLSLTEPGRFYFDRCKTILDDLDAAELELGALGSTPRGTLRVTAPSWTAGQRLLANLLAEYRRRYPEIVVDLSFEDRPVDLVEEGYDLAIRVTGVKDSLPAGLVARPVRPATFYLAASRDYIKRHGIPQSAEDLARHDFVALRNMDSLPLTGAKGKVEIPMRVVLRYRSLAGIANAVAAGIGLAPVPALFFDDPVFKDVLVPILTERPLFEATLYLLYVSRTYMPLKIRTFVDFFVESIARIPNLKPAPAG
jgi:DNA-binding transcriptional LysR family regulator